MQITTITVGDIGENTYQLDNGTEIVLIDPGADYAKIKAAMGDKPCRHVLLTHAHFDHIGAVAPFARDGARVYLHRDDEKLLHGNGNLAPLFGASLDMFAPSVLLGGEETLSLPCGTCRVISTPGHTDGSVCYLFDDALFSGDTLFRLSVGRTDFPSGSAAKLHESLHALFSLDADTTVYPGHGEPTTLHFEKQYNPYA